MYQISMYQTELVLSIFIVLTWNQGACSWVDNHFVAVDFSPLEKWLWIHHGFYNHGALCRGGEASKEKKVPPIPYEAWQGEVCFSCDPAMLLCSCPWSRTLVFLIGQPCFFFNGELWFNMWFTMLIQLVIDQQPFHAWKKQPFWSSSGF